MKCNKPINEYLDTEEWEYECEESEVSSLPTENVPLYSKAIVLDKKYILYFDGTEWKRWGGAAS